MNIRSFTIYDLFKRNGKIYKNRIAIQTEKQQISFGKLFDQVNILAGSLNRKGIKKGDRIAVLAKNYPQYLTLMGGIAASGAIMVPINFRLTADEIGYNLTNTQPAMICVDPDFEKTILDLRSLCPSVRDYVTFGPGGEKYEPFDSLLSGQPFKAIDLSGDDPYIIMHTAAVQGKPRGAIISHHNLITCSIQSIGLLGLTPQDAYLNILPLFHIAGMMASPILLQLLDEASKGEFSLSPLRHVLGIELPETVKRFENLGHGQFWLAYGQTETMGLTCICSNRERPGCAGKPGPLVNVKIIDEFDQELEMGKVGEILIQSPMVFHGYWGEEELTRHTFRDGWHHTGDAGRLDEDGFLWFAGRKAEKELIKPGGENVYPVEVEKVILEHPSISEVSVIGVPDPKFGEGIKAVCVLKSKAKLTEQELIDFVAGRIARYKKPGYVQFVDSLPKKGDGSIDRAKVKELYGAGLKS